jgi:hypothetical protein
VAQRLRRGLQPVARTREALGSNLASDKVSLFLDLFRFSNVQEMPSLLVS